MFLVLMCLIGIRINRVEKGKELINKNSCL